MCGNTVISYLPGTRFAISCYAEPGTGSWPGRVVPVQMPRRCVRTGNKWTLLQPNSNGLQPNSDGFQPNSNGLQPPSDGLQI